MNQIKEFLNDHKKIAITGLALVILISAFFVVRSVMQKSADITENMVFETLARGPLSVYVSATGVVTSNQSAVLNWNTSGEIEDVTPYLGQSVVAGDLLASLDESSLSPFVILALADLVSAQKSLDDLLLSSTQQAQSLKAVENAEQSLEDARDPSKLQADAQLILAEKAKALESAQRRYDILTTPPTELVINQAYANRLLAQQALADLEEQIDRFERKVNSAPAVFLRNIYQKALDGLQLRLHSQLARYNDTLEKYAILTSPPDPLDMIVAQAELATAQAQYAGARLSWERIKNGLSAADIAILEAVLSDAHREWERVKDGPTSQDIAVAQARVAAAQAALNQVQLTAPFDGVITQISAQPGDLVNTGAMAFRIDDLSTLLVNLNVSEMAISQVAVDQDVLLTLDAVFAQTYHGKVVDVSPVGIEVSGVVNFDVVVNIADADQGVRPGMTVDVDLLVHQVADALLVPNQAVRWLDGEQVVYVLGSNPPEDYIANNSEGRSSVGLVEKSIYPVVVILGLKSDSYSEVIAGNISVGDQILLSLPNE